MSPLWLCKLLCNLWAVRLWDKSYIVGHTGMAMVIQSFTTVWSNWQDNVNINSHETKIVWTFLFKLWRYFNIPEKNIETRYCSSIKSVFLILIHVDFLSISCFMLVLIESPVHGILFAFVGYRNWCIYNTSGRTEWCVLSTYSMCLHERTIIHQSWLRLSSLHSELNRLLERHQT